MSDYVTKTELNATLDKALREQTDEIVGLIQSFMTHVDTRFEGVEQRLDAMDTRFEGVEQRLDAMDTRFEGVEQRLFIMDTRFERVEQRLDSLDAKYDRLLNTIDGFIARIDRYETEMAARDGQFERLLAWARKVSEKTGIPLENL